MVPLPKSFSIFPSVTSRAFSLSLFISFLSLLILIVLLFVQVQDLLSMFRGVYLCYYLLNNSFFINNKCCSDNSKITLSIHLFFSPYTIVVQDFFRFICYEWKWEGIFTCKIFMR